MKKYISISLGLMFLLAGFTNVWAADNNQDNKEAQKFIESWYATEKQHDMTKLDKFFAPQFISIGRDIKIRDRAQEMEMYKTYTLNNYTLSDFQFTRSGDVIIGIYRAKMDGNMEGKAFDKKPAERMIVLQKQNGQWVILALASYATSK